MIRKIEKLDETWTGLEMIDTDNKGNARRDSKNLVDSKERESERER